MPVNYDALIKFLQDRDKELANLEATLPDTPPQPQEEPSMIGSGLKRGALDILSDYARVAQGLGVESAGDFAKGLEQKAEAIPIPQDWRRYGSIAIENIIRQPESVAAIGLGALAAPFTGGASLPIALAIGGAIPFVKMGVSEGIRKKEQIESEVAKRLGVNVKDIPKEYKELAKREGLKHGLMQGGVEALGGLVEVGTVAKPILRSLPRLTKVVKAGSKPIAEIVKAPKFLKTYAQLTAEELTEEVIQTQDELNRDARLGLPQPDDKTQVWLDTIIGTMATTLVYGAGAKVGHVIQSKQVKQHLTSNESDPRSRLQAISYVASGIEDPSARADFIKVATDIRLNQNKPLPLDEGMDNIIKNYIKEGITNPQTPAQALFAISSLAEEVPANNREVFVKSATQKVFGKTLTQNDKIGDIQPKPLSKTTNVSKIFDELLPKGQLNLFESTNLKDAQPITPMGTEQLKLFENLPVEGQLDLFSKEPTIKTTEQLKLPFPIKGEQLDLFESAPEVVKKPVKRGEQLNLPFTGAIPMQGALFDTALYKLPDEQAPSPTPQSFSPTPPQGEVSQGYLPFPSKGLYGGLRLREHEKEMIERYDNPGDYIKENFGQTKSTKEFLTKWLTALKTNKQDKFFEYLDKQKLNEVQKDVLFGRMAIIENLFKKVKEDPTGEETVINPKSTVRYATPEDHEKYKDTPLFRVYRYDDKGNATKEWATSSLEDAVDIYIKKVMSEPDTMFDIVEVDGSKAVKVGINRIGVHSNKWGKADWIELKKDLPKSAVRNILHLPKFFNELNVEHPAIVSTAKKLKLTPVGTMRILNKIRKSGLTGRGKEAEVIRELITYRAQTGKQAEEKKIPKVEPAPKEGRKPEPKKGTKVEPKPEKELKAKPTEAKTEPEKTKVTAKFRKPKKSPEPIKKARYSKFPQRRKTIDIVQGLEIINKGIKSIVLPYDNKGELRRDNIPFNTLNGWTLVDDLKEYNSLMKGYTSVSKILDEREFVKQLLLGQFIGNSLYMETVYEKTPTPKSLLEKPLPYPLEYAVADVDSPLGAIEMPISIILRHINHELTMRAYGGTVTPMSILKDVDTYFNSVLHVLNTLESKYKGTLSETGKQVPHLLQEYKRIIEHYHDIVKKFRAGEQYSISDLMDMRNDLFRVFRYAIKIFTSGKLTEHLLQRARRIYGRPMGVTIFNTDSNNYIENIVSGKPTAWQALQALRDSAYDNRIAAFANIIMSLATKNTDLMYQLKYINVLIDDGIPYEGYFDPFDVDIRVKSAWAGSEEVLMHEIWHAVTYYVLRTSRGKKAIKELNEILKHIYAHYNIDDKAKTIIKEFGEPGSATSTYEYLRKGDFIGDSPFLEYLWDNYGHGMIDIVYALSDAEELLAQAGSSSSVQNFLLGIEMPKKRKRTLFDWIKDILQTLFGKTKETNALTQVLDISIETTSKFKYDDMLKYHNRFNFVTTPDSKLHSKALTFKERFGIGLTPDSVFNFMSPNRIKEFVQDTKHIKLKDISPMREHLGLPFWTALTNKDFMPLFRHITTLYEKKNYNLHTIIDGGEQFFKALPEDERPAVYTAVVLSDALGVWLPDNILSRLPSWVKEIRTKLDNLEFGEDGTAEWFRIEFRSNKEDFIKIVDRDDVVRYKRLFDAYLKKVSYLNENQRKAYHNQQVTAKRTLRFMRDSIRKLVVYTVVGNPSLASQVLYAIENPRDAESLDDIEDIKTLIEEVKKSSLYQKAEQMSNLLKQVDFYLPRVRDNDAKYAVVVFKRDVFDELYDKALDKYYDNTGDLELARVKALEEATLKASSKHGVMERWHVNRYDTKKRDELQQAYGDDYIVKIVPNYKLAESLYSGINEGSIGSFISSMLEHQTDIDASTMNKIMDKVMEEIQTTILARSKTAQKFIKRSEKLILGYDMEDLGTIMFNYINNATNHIARIEALVEGLPLLNKIDPRQQRRLRNYADKWFWDMLTPQTKADRTVGKLRSLMFLWWLGGNIRAGVVQATQMLVTAVPMMSLYTNSTGKAMKYISKAYRDVLFAPSLEDNKNLTDDEKKALEETYNRGASTAQFINQFRDEVTGRFKHKTLNRIVRLFSQPFAYLEERNRLASALALYRYIKDSGKETTEKISERGYRIKPSVVKELIDFINQTQFLMGKINLPSFARGKGFAPSVLRTAYTFRAFTHNLLEMYNYAIRHVKSGETLFGLDKNGMRIIGLSMASLMVLGGLTGIPFLDDLLALIERLTGKPIRKAPTLLLGDELGLMVERGIPTIAGVDISGSMQIGIPTSFSEIEQSVFGVYGGLAENIYDGLTAMQGGNSLYTFTKILPVALSNPLKAYLAYQGITTGSGKIIYDENGNPVKLSSYEAWMQAVGLRPARLSKTYSYKSSAYSIKTFFDSWRNEIYARYRNASTPKERAEVRKEILAYNKKALGVKGVPRITYTSLKTIVKPSRNKIAEGLKSYTS